MLDFKSAAIPLFIWLLLHISTTCATVVAEKDERKTNKQGMPYIVTCVGDSLTTGNDMDKRVGSYPNFLQQQLGEKHYKVINGGAFGVADKKSVVAVTAN